MRLKQAIEGFILDGKAGSYAPSTIVLQKLYLNRLADYLNEPDIKTIKPDDLYRFMVYLHQEYKPKRINSPDKSPLSPAAIDYHRKSIRGFFRWCEKHLNIKRPDLDLPRPKYKSPQVVPFNEEEIKKMINACEYTRDVNPSYMYAFYSCDLLIHKALFIHNALYSNSV